MKNEIVPAQRQPVLFVSWKSPLQAIGEDDGLRQSLRRVGETLSAVDAVVIFTTHVPQRDVNRGALIVNGAARPSLIRDFIGYPEELYSLTYPAFGHPDLAVRVAGRLISAGIGVRLDSERGWEHRVWMPLRELFPKANVPILEIGAALGDGVEMLLQAGAALSFLRERGILLMAVGGGVTDESFDPLLFAVGAVGPDDRVVQIHDGVTFAGTESSLALVA
jgi:4,5-DOPA dioxygenase extradiol